MEMTDCISHVANSFCHSDAWLGCSSCIAIELILDGSRF